MTTDHKLVGVIGGMGPDATVDFDLGTTKPAFLLAYDASGRFLAGCWNVNSLFQVPPRTVRARIVALRCRLA